MLGSPATVGAEPKEKAQTGMIVIKTAVGEILAENNNNWLRRNQIEESLGLWSEYGSGTYGAVASMMTGQRGRGWVSRREPDGRTWLYRMLAKANITALPALRRRAGMECYSFPNSEIKVD